MIRNRNIDCPLSHHPFKCKNDKQCFTHSKPPQFQNNPCLGAQGNKNNFQSLNSLSTLRFQQPSKEVFQFNSQSPGNRLKARHKRFVTMDFQAQIAMANFSHNCSELQGNSFCEPSFESKNTFHYSNNDFGCSPKTQLSKTTIKSKQVWKNPFEEEENQHQINMFHQSQMVKKVDGPQVEGKDYEPEKMKSNFLNFRPQKRVKPEQFDWKTNENESWSQITKTKPLKWMSSQRKQLSQPSNQQPFQSPQLKNGQSNDFTFKKTKKRSASNFQNYLPSQRNIHKPSILQKQVAGESHTSHLSPKETIYSGRFSLQKTNNLSNRQQQHQNLENYIEKTCIKPQSQSYNKSDYSSLIQDSLPTPYLKKRIQSVQEQSEPSSSEEKESEEIRTAKLGIAKSLENTCKIKNRKNRIGKLSELNDELDFGLKLIDNSFQVSGFDYDYATSNIFSNVQECQDNQLHQLKTCYTRRSENQSCKQEPILEESLISPQCEALKSKLNRMLSQEGQNCQQSKPKLQRLSSETFTHNNKSQNSSQSFKMTYSDLETTVKDQQGESARLELVSRSGHDGSKYEPFLYGSFICSKSTIEEKRKMVELQTLGLRFNLKIGMLTQQTVYLISHTKEIMKLINIISKIQSFPKHFHVIQSYSLNFNMCSNRLTIIKDPILLANKFETIYPMAQAHSLEVNLVETRKIIKQVLSVMYQSISAQSVFVDIRDVYILASKNKKATEFNVKIDIAQSFLSQANTQQFQYSSFGQNVETVLKIIRILTSKGVSDHNYDMKIHLQSFVDLLEETLTGNKQVGIEDILIHPFVWHDST